jgi:hypothetical protein
MDIVMDSSKIAMVSVSTNSGKSSDYKDAEKGDLSKSKQIICKNPNIHEPIV